MNEKCESCWIREGGSQCHELLTEYRSHIICGWCQMRWQSREEMFDRTIEFEEFKAGIKSKKVFESQWAIRLRKRNEEIRKEWMDGKTLYQLARQFSLGERSISRIIGE